MDKKDIVLVVLNRDILEETVKNLNLDHVNVILIFTDGYDGRTFNVGGREVLVLTFASINVIRKFRRLLWLICGSEDKDYLRKIKRILMVGRVPEVNIVNIETPAQISGTWLANLRYIENYDADFFVTGNEYTQVNMNINLLPLMHANTFSIMKGILLADTGQTLRQSYFTAKHVFEHVKPGTIKFVFIGLEPSSFHRDDAANFSHALQNLQYAFALKNVEDTSNDRLLQTLYIADFKNTFNTVSAKQADLNFDAVKANFNSGFSAKTIFDWQDIAQPLPTVAVKNNVQILTDYIELCIANGAKPIGVVFPFAPAARRYIDAGLLKTFRDTIHQLEETHDFNCIDMFELGLNYDCFCDMEHLNARGRDFANAFLAFKLQEKNIIPFENFCHMPYECLDKLAYLMPANDYHAFLDKIFEISAQKIRRKDKIKLAFVLYDTSMWSGDELYNCFAQNPRFEVTVFLHRISKTRHESIGEAFSEGVEQFKSHNLNVVVPGTLKGAVPEQDVIILLTPYPSGIPPAFQLTNLTPKTLLTHISYSFDVANRGRGFHNRSIFHTSWRIFLSSAIALDVYSRKSVIGMPRGRFSGHPKIDVFFEQGTNFHFDWKMTRPDAKKIIWAPHHSIPEGGVHYATFQWNYKFMYEFAKAHPEISWVVKPHPALAYRAIDAKLFPSDHAFTEYLKAWDDLPNAQVYTGAYYQAIFATSDGMIHDSGSFIAEYQFVDKPMIYLTRTGETFNELGNAILDVSYCVDGKDHKAIAATLKRVIIDGDDFKAAARRELFDKHLNYPKYNGMLASEFIYHSIADELKEISE